jgi:hypothetical protein
VSDNKGRARDVLNILLINRPVDAVLGWLGLIDKDPRHSLGMKIAQQTVELSYTGTGNNGGVCVEERQAVFIYLQLVRNHPFLAAQVL